MATNAIRKLFEEELEMSEQDKLYRFDFCIEDEETEEEHHYTLIGKAKPMTSEDMWVTAT